MAPVSTLVPHSGQNVVSSSNRKPHLGQVTGFLGGCFCFTLAPHVGQKSKLLGSSDPHSSHLLSFAPSTSAPHSEQKAAPFFSVAPQLLHTISSFDSTDSFCSDSTNEFPQLGQISNESSISTPQRLHLTIFTPS